MLQDRTAKILETSIREFIKTGEPVSSGELFDQYDFGIRPARIRSELQLLTEMGFLEQPYHSAGRVPSDTGYQFFVERILEKNEEHNSLDRTFEHFLKRSQWEDLIESMSDHLGILGVIDDFQGGHVYKDGLDGLLEQLDWQDPGEIKEVVRDFENLDERLEEARGIFQEVSNVRVFIGKRSPVTESSQLSVIASEYRDGDKNILLLAIGPKRMNYQKVISVFQHLS
ncbi:MAG: hypothetical protein AAB652_02430 [Patescibacteria group bacterium]